MDASAVLAVVLEEPDRDIFLDAILASRARMSVVGYVEMALRLDRFVDRRLSEQMDARLAEFGIELVPVSVDQAREARAAFQRFGRGASPARLNLGDCFAYALARVTGETLLFKGGDFPHTDIMPALG